MTTGPGFEPLTEDEAALARRLRALPGGSPAPELDARVLAAARAAVARQRPPARPWLWGLSTAAVAVLAVGMFWRAGLPPVDESQQYRPLQVPGTAGQGEAEQGEVPAAASPRPKARPAEIESRHAPVADSPVSSPSNLSAELPADPPAEPRTERAPAATTSAASRAAPATERSRATERLDAPAPMVLPAPAQQAAPAAPPPPATLQADAGTADDPATWLARIEALLDDGEIAEAREELQAFRSAHPRYPLPDALQRLLDGH